MAQKRQTAVGTYEVSKGFEMYRGHVLQKWMLSLAGVPFWRVEIFAIGFGANGVATPLAMVQYRCDEASLPKTVSEAKLVVGWFIRYGMDVPATSVPENYMAKSNDPLDALIMRSKSGKPATCGRHWSEVKALGRRGKVVPIVFGARLVQRLVTKLGEEGIITKQAVSSTHTMQLLLDSYAPVCCWLGEEELAKLIADCDPKVILERARQANV